MAPALFALVVGGVLARWAGWLTPFAFDLGFAVFVAASTCSSLRRFRARPLVVFAIGIALPALALAAMLFRPEVRLGPYLAIAIVNGLVAYGFSRGLRDDEPGIIRQVILLTGSGPDGGPEWRAYARVQSLMWTVFGALSSLVAVLAMLSPVLRETLGTVLGIGFAVQIAWFVLAHEYAQWRFGRPESWRDTLRYMSRPSIWRELDL